MEVLFLSPYLSPSFCCKCVLRLQEAADARDDVQDTLPTDDDEKEVTLLTKEEDDEAGPPLPVPPPHQTSPKD